MVVRQHHINDAANKSCVGDCTGGRVTGADSIAEMIRELHLSVDAGRGFEGEMARLSSYSRSEISSGDVIQLAAKLQNILLSVYPG